MKNPKAVCLALLLVLCVSPTLKAQDEPPLAIQVRQILKQKEPSWQYIAVMQSGRSPLVPSERRILAGVWERKGKSVKRETVGIYIYRVENSLEGAKWLNPVRSGQVAADWQVVKYNIGEEGYLAKYQNGKQFEIHFREGNLVVQVSGSDLGIIERFAKNIVAQMPAI